MSRLTTTDRMSNTGYHQLGKPNWWAMIKTDEVDVPTGTTVYCGAGKGSRKTVRETVVTS